MLGKKLSKLVYTYITEDLGGYAVNVVSASKNGVPDILACISGTFYGFEIKGKGDRASNLQLHNIKLISLAKGKAGLVKSIKDVDDIIAGVYQLPTLPSKEQITL